MISASTSQLWDRSLLFRRERSANTCLSLDLGGSHLLSCELIQGVDLFDKCNEEHQTRTVVSWSNNLSLCIVHLIFSVAMLGSFDFTFTEVHQCCQLSLPVYMLHYYVASTNLAARASARQRSWRSNPRQIVDCQSTHRETPNTAETPNDEGIRPL